MNKYETDVLGLKEEMRVSLQTSMNTGKFKRAIHDSFDIQVHTDERVVRVGERVEGFELRRMNVYNDEFKVSTIFTHLPPQLAQDHLYYNFLQKDEDVEPQVTVITEHRFTHAYVAMTVLALTIAFLFLSYGCFLSRACRRIRNQDKGGRFSGDDDSTRDIEIVFDGGGTTASSPFHRSLGGRDRAAVEEIVEGDMEEDTTSAQGGRRFNNTETIAF